MKTMFLIGLIVLVSYVVAPGAEATTCYSSSPSYVTAVKTRDSYRPNSYTPKANQKCKSGYSMIYNYGWCVQACKSGYKYTVTKNRCFGPCPSGYYVSGELCLASCRSGYVSYSLRCYPVCRTGYRFSAGRCCR